jgi:hypothetical protein
MLFQRDAESKMQIQKDTELERFRNTKVLSSSVSVIDTAKYEFSGVIDTAESKHGSVGDGTKSKFGSVADTADSKLSSVVDTAGSDLAMSLTLLNRQSQYLHKTERCS